LSAPAASDANPSQIAAASSPATIRADRFGQFGGLPDLELDRAGRADRGLFHREDPGAACAIALITGSVKPSRRKPSAIAAAGPLSRIS
jgi:hypothetical protein